MPRLGLAADAALAVSALVGAALFGILLTPGTAAAGGAWTLEEGHLWGKLALVYQRSDQHFADPITSTMLACGEPISASDRMPFDCTTGGVFEVTALYADLMWGIIDGVDVRLQVPLILSQSFWNESGLNARQDVAFGDIRVGGQFRFIADPVLASLRWEVKIPTGFFTADEGIPAVGEGQWDLTAIAAVSRGVGDAWFNAEVGWRFRFENPTTGIDVGDEFLALGEAGYRFLPWLMVPLKLELIYGLESTNPTEPTPRPGRWVFNVLASAILAFEEIEPVAFELGIRVPVIGQGYPSLPVFTIGVWGELDMY